MKRVGLNDRKGRSIHGFGGIPGKSFTDGSQEWEEENKNKNIAVEAKREVESSELLLEKMLSILAYWEIALMSEVTRRNNKFELYLQEHC